MKRVGQNIYVHRSAAWECLPEEEYQKACEIMTGAHWPTWDYVKYNKKTGTFTFTWCRGWCDLHEPVVTTQVLINIVVGTRKHLKINSLNPPIIHGKHFFAGIQHPEEVGFDIEEAKARWNSYQGADWLDKSRMGFLKWWREHAVPMIGE